VSSLHGWLRTARRTLPAACAVALCAPTAAWGATAYQPRPVCAAPAPGHAGCLALELVPAGSAAPLRARAPLTRALHARPGLAPSVRAGQQQAGTSYAAGQTPEPLDPAQLLKAYGLPPEPLQGSAPQTIALVDAYNDPAAEADLGVYDTHWGLAACTAANGCFTKVNQLGAAATEGAGGTPFPKSTRELEEREGQCKTKQQGCAETEEAEGWDVEISTDLDVAHSVCQSCHILLVEADSPAYTNLEAAEDTAATLGATEISNSWGGSEPGDDSPAFDHPGIVLTAAAGDDGYLNWTLAGEPGYFAGADYPASSPHVVAVGGTELTVSESGARRSETVWNEDPDPTRGNEGAGGSGCSAQFAAPAWQLEMIDWASVGCETGAAATRAVADVAADADPYSGVLVYDSDAAPEDLIVIGGTSVASPIIASVFALAGGAHGVAYPAQTLYYRHGRDGSPGLYDVTGGGNGKCDDVYTEGCSGSLVSPLDCGAGALVCNAAPGYDGPTGVGAPAGISAFEPESPAEHTTKVEAEAAAEKQANEEREAAERLTREAAERKATERRAAEEAAHQLEVETRDAEARRAEEERQAAERALTGAAGVLAGAGGGAGAGTGTGTGRAPLNPGTSGPGGSLTGHAGPSASTSGGAWVRLTALALTPRASAALTRSRPARTAVTFAFVLSAPARVRVTLARRVGAHGHARWATVPGAFTLAAGGSRGHGRLRGRGLLPPGRYRLTLTPAHGAGRSLVFAVR
jgi:hypothetical protein